MVHPDQRTFRTAQASADHHYSFQGVRVSTRDIVQTRLAAVVAEHSPMPFPDAIDDDDELDIFGLDSLAFMSLLTSIEQEVGYIPKVILEGDLYPETFGDLVAAYDS